MEPTIKSIQSGLPFWKFKEEYNKLLVDTRLPKEAYHAIYSRYIKYNKEKEL